QMFGAQTQASRTETQAHGAKTQTDRSLLPFRELSRVRAGRTCGGAPAAAARPAPPPTAAEQAVPAARRHRLRLAASPGFPPRVKTKRSWSVRSPAWQAHSP